MLGKSNAQVSCQIVYEFIAPGFALIDEPANIVTQHFRNVCNKNEKGFRDISLEKEKRKQPKYKHLINGIRIFSFVVFTYYTQKTNPRHLPICKWFGFVYVVNGL